MAIPTNDDIWADFNLDGSVKEPFKQDIRRKMNFIEALATAAGVGAKAYSTKTAMDADLSQPDGTVGLIYADPTDANNYPTLWYWNDAGNVWVMGVDRIGNMTNALTSATTGVADLYTNTGTPRAVAFADPASYLQTWVTISSPSTRFTITPSAAGYQVTGLAGLSSSIWPVGVKLPWDLIAGDRYYIRGKYTAGTLTANSGFWIGTDPTTTGDMTTSARMTIYRAGNLLACTQNGTSSDGARTVSPTFVPAGVTPALNDIIDIVVDVLSDRSLAFTVFANGLQVARDVTVAPATAAGAVCVGMMIANGQTGIITRLARRTSRMDAVLYMNSGVASSGDGTLDSPLKSLTDVPKAITDLGLTGRPITIQMLSDNVYGYLQLKETVSPHWRIKGIAGGNTTILGSVFNEAASIVWTLAAGTTKVYTTVPHWGTETRSQANQPFLFGYSWNPRPWYTFPHKALPLVTTANSGVDMDGLTGGAHANAGGLLYVRLPDGVGPNPSSLPSGGISLILARTGTILETIGSPTVECEDITLRWSSAALFSGGAGKGTFTRCNFEWSGYNADGVEQQNGQYRYKGCKWNYTDADCLGTTLRVDMPYQVGATHKTIVEDCEFGYTGQQGSLGGDAISVHITEDGTNRRHELWMKNCWIHDIWKCGVVPLTDLWVMDGCIVERCGTEQVALFGVPTASSTGRTQRAFIRNTRIDPQSLGATGVKTVYTDGMALCEIQLDNCWIGTPAGGGSELEVTAVALSGQTRDITKNIIRYRNVTTERAVPVKTGGGTLGTFTLVAATPLT